MKLWRFLLCFALFTLFKTLPAAAQCTHPPGQHCVDLSWTASTTPGVTYNIYRSTSANACVTGTKLNTVPITTPTYVDQLLPASNGVTYNYGVDAEKGGDHSTCTPDVQVQIPTPPQPPTNPAAVVR